MNELKDTDVQDMGPLSVLTKLQKIFPTGFAEYEWVYFHNSVTQCPKPHGRSPRSRSFSCLHENAMRVGLHSRGASWKQTEDISAVWCCGDDRQL